MKVTKRQLRRIIREEKRRLLEGYEEERAAAAASTHFKPAPQFPKMTYPEDRAEPGDLYVNLTDEQENALSALEQALSACLNVGCTPADILDTTSSMVS